MEHVLLFLRHRMPCFPAAAATARRLPSKTAPPLGAPHVHQDGACNFAPPASQARSPCMPSCAYALPDGSPRASLKKRFVVSGAYTQTPSTASCTLPRPFIAPCTMDPRVTTRRHTKRSKSRCSAGEWRWWRWWIGVDGANRLATAATFTVSVSQSPSLICSL